MKRLSTMLAMGALLLATAAPALAMHPITFGTNGPDDLRGTAEADDMRGERGDDVLRGLGGGDTVYGGHDRDAIYGGPSSDFLQGYDWRTPNDTRPASDWISGGSGDDRIRGGGGADSLVGGSGSDRLMGGTGNDSLVAASNTSDSGVPDKDAIYCGAGNDEVTANSFDFVASDCEKVRRV